MPKTSCMYVGVYIYIYIYICTYIHTFTAPEKS